MVLKGDNTLEDKCVQNDMNCGCVLWKLHTFAARSAISDLWEIRMGTLSSEIINICHSAQIQQQVYRFLTGKKLFWPGSMLDSMALFHWAAKACIGIVMLGSQNIIWNNCNNWPRTHKVEGTWPVIIINRNCTQAGGWQQQMLQANVDG